MTQYLTHCSNCPDWKVGLQLCKECFLRAEKQKEPFIPQEKKSPKNFRLSAQTLKKISVLKKLQEKDQTSLIEEGISLYYLLSMMFATEKQSKESVNTTIKEQGAE